MLKPRHVYDLLTELAQEAEAEYQAYRDKFGVLADRAGAVTKHFSDAHSSSWIGYQSLIYITGFRRRTPTDHFDKDWGPTRGSGNWNLYDSQDVEEKWLQDVGTDNPEVERIEAEGRDISVRLKRLKTRGLAAIDALGADHKMLTSIREEISAKETDFAANHLIEAIRPQRVVTRDMRAFQGGLQTPPHISLQARVWSATLAAKAGNELAEMFRRARDVMEVSFLTGVDMTADRSKKIFIGHGRSPIWRELKDFLTERLKLQCVEFNSDPAAGLATKERLEEMLDAAVFAFIILTAEEQQSDGTFRARENVVHEAGLFQGRLGFRKAILLLEEGCSEFSNIVGLTQVRFPKGTIAAGFEDIRRVLERERVI